MTMQKKILLIFLASLIFASCAKKEEPEKGLDPASFEAAFGSLAQSSVSWSELGQGDKIKAVSRFIELFKEKENTGILNSPKFYVGKIDEMTQGNPELRANLPTLVKMVAIMEYDFYNGQNKDELARQALGETMYQTVKARRKAAGLV